MLDFELTAHAKDMLIERNIPEEWVWLVLQSFDKKQLGDDGNMHYTKAIVERDNRILHIIVNITIQPNRIVTLFFDRRLGKRV